MLLKRFAAVLNTYNMDVGILAAAAATAALGYAATLAPVQRFFTYMNYCTLRVLASVWHVLIAV